MFKKIKNIFFITSFLIFLILVSKHYFSEKNIIKTNKARSLYLFNLSNNEKITIPLLKNDTNNVIEYIDEAENFIEKKKKFTFWNLLKKNDE